MKRFISIICCMVLLMLSLPSANAETTSDTTRYALNSAAVEAGNLTKSASSVTVASGYVQVFQYGYIDYKVNVPSAATYLMDIYYCTKVSTLNLKINVNENPVISSAPLSNTNSYTANKTETLGKIDLKAGENTIRIQVLDEGSEAEWILANYFALTKIGDIFYYPMTVDTFTGEGASYNNGVTPAGFVSSQNAMDMRDVNGGTNPTWVQKPITVTKSGWYGVSTLVGTYESFEFCIDAIILDANGNITGRVSSSIPHTGGMTTYKNNYMGMIYLEEGTHTIKFMCTNGVAYVKSFTIGQVQDDLTQSASFDFLVRKDTVDIDNFISSTDSLNRISVQLTKNNSFKIYIYTEKALNYDLALKCGTIQDGQNINVSVNGYKQIEDGIVNATSANGSYVPKGKQIIGSIYLNRGFNEIEISRGNTTSVPVFVERVYFDLADSFKDGYLTVYSQEKRVPEYSDGTVFATVANDNCVSIIEGTTLIYDIYTTEAQVDDVLAEAIGGSEFVISATVNGVLQFSSEIASIDGKETAYSSSGVLGTVNIPAGYSTLEFTINGGSGYLRNLLLEPSNVSETQILSFELQNVDGVRVPYSVSEDIDIYGAVEIKKVGDADDNIMLIVAEYDINGKLVNAKTENINVSEMASREVKAFRTKLTLKGEGGSVKAFAFDKENLYPYAEEIPSYTDAMIFTPEAISDIKNTTVNYVKATTLETNTAGTYYQDTGIYNDDYTVTPIFYEAHNGAKVFAYLGVPANASKDNPVPAMVCVHGGNGQAYRTWVENWAKHGFAAIAMDLYGCAPEGEYGWTYNEEQNYLKSPYVGNMQSPWNASAYSKDGDFRQGSMYQNVVNVMYAHNILRGLEEVDLSKIGITGVSWGGVTATTTIGVDDRFAFAAPIYGCGYLDIGKGGFDMFYKYSDGTINWEPINFAAKSDIPILYLNGNNDQNFSALSSSYSVGVAKEGYLSIYNNLAHSQVTAEGIEQVYRFAENMVEGNNPYIKIETASVEDNVLTIKCTIPDGTTLEKVKLYYITDEEYPDITSYSSVKWQTVSEYTDVDGIVSINVPDGATYLYAELTDQNGDILCTKILY